MKKSDFGERLFNKVFTEIPKLSSRIQQLEKYIMELIMNIIEKIPRYESFIMEMVEFAFGPRQIFYHLLVIVGLQIVTSGVEVGRSLLLHLWRLLTVKGRRENKLLKDLSACLTYADWRAVAAQLDATRGLDGWRISDASAFYDYRVLRKRILDTIQMIQRGDVFNLIFRLRGGLARDQFGITHAALFSKAMAGTKSIIENYHETVSSALNFIVDSPIAEEEIPPDAKLAFFNETRHSYGRTAFLLSGGAYLGFYHFGVARALWKEGLLPRVISGASAGSLTAALLGTRTNEELDKILLYDDAIHESLESFHIDFLKIDTKIKSPLGAKIQSWIPPSLRKYFDQALTFIFDGRLANIDNDHFRDTIKHNFGEITFQEAFDRSGRIINVVVAPLNSYEPPRLLNYLTAPHVCVWSAVFASCAIPGVFDSTSLYCKEPNGDYRPEHEWSGHRSAFIDVDAHLAHAYSDGSFENDLPMEQLSELFNVNHFIVSQVNVQSAFLSSLFLPNPWWNNSTLFAALVAYIRFLKSHVHDWLKNIINMITQNSGAQSWATRRGLVQTLLQEYEGREKDVTIMPWKGHINVIQACMSILKNPTEEEFVDVVRAGERNTWPFIPRIKAHCLVEMSLDTCVQKLRRQIARDSATNKAKLIQGRGETDKINRLPSFYTTRSIINLSGLSVGDPVPTYRPITALNHNNPNPAINSRGGPSPLAGSGYSTGAGFNNSINDYGLESDFNGKKPSSHDNLSNRTSSNSLTAVASESSPTRMSSGNLDASPKNNTINNNVDSLLDMSSEENDELFASVPAPDMYLPLKDEKTRPSILKSSRNGLSSVVTTGSDVSSNNYNSSNNMDKNSEYTLGYSPRDKNKEASPLDPSGESNSSLYGLVPGADTLLTDSPRSSIVSSRYTRIPKPSNDETLTDEQRQQQYLDLTLTSANLGDVNAGKANDLNEKKSGITKTTQMSNFYYKRSASEDELTRATLDASDPMHPDYNLIRRSRGPMRASNSK